MLVVMSLVIVVEAAVVMVEVEATVPVVVVSNSMQNSTTKSIAHPSNRD